MSISETESLATLELLVAIARADGTVEPAERDALEAAFAGASLPSGLSLAQLLEAKTDVDDILRRVTTPEARERAFEAAFTLAKADGECAPSEQAILDRARTAWEIPAEKVSTLDRIISEARDTVLPSNIQAISDPTARAAATAASPIAVRRCAVMPGAGASSITFWWRRCTEQSRSNSDTQLPWLSPKTWISMWRGRCT